LNIQVDYETLPLGTRFPLFQKGTIMKKTLIAVAAAAALAASAMAPAPAEARGGGIAAGVAAGLIGGALVGGAVAAGSPYGYGPGYYYAPAPEPYYGGPTYIDDPGAACYLQRQRFWDGYAWRVRRVRVCE
jgi:opacity protein-like surface antigen